MTTIEATATVPVVLVGTQDLVSAGFACVLNREPEVEVVATTRSVDEAIDIVTGVPRAVVVFDDPQDGRSSLGAIQRLRAVAPDAQVVLLASMIDPCAVAGAVEAGCTGFLVKSSGADELRRAVKAAGQGEPYFASDALMSLVRLRRRQSDLAGGLSIRERTVLEGVARGATVETIADELGLSPHTVRNHLRRAMVHLGVHRRLDAVIAAASAGLIELPAGSRP